MRFQTLGQELDTLDKQDNEIASSIGLTECAKDISPQGWHLTAV